jgi:hypothetical protein
MELFCQECQAVISNTDIVVTDECDKYTYEEYTKHGNPSDDVLFCSHECWATNLDRIYDNIRIDSW